MRKQLSFVSVLVMAAMAGVGCGDNGSNGDAGSVGGDATLNDVGTGGTDGGGSTDEDTGTSTGTDSGPPTEAGAEDTGVQADAGADAAVDPAVAACRAAIATRETAVTAMLPWSRTDATEMVRTGGDQNREADYAGRYRDDLATHPGCEPRTAYGNNVEFLVTDNQATVAPGVPANIPGYPCAAKEYTQANENTALPIVILVHGNSSSVTTFEEYDVMSRRGTTITSSGGLSFTVDAAVRAQLASRLVAAGHRVIAFDGRTDLVNTLADFDSASATGNPFRNVDHGWTVPMLQSLIRAVIAQAPTRKIALVGHSLGVTVIRDALRRLYNEHRTNATAVNPFEHISDVVLLSGANHGVSSGAALCTSFGSNMKGTVGCEMGDRAAFQPTYFSRPLNGPSDLFVAPCADGSYAYGDRDQCGGNVVSYTTVTMEDLPSGMLQDEFISEASSALDLEPCVENVLLPLSDYDSSSYFFTGAPGFFASHFGSARSNAGIDAIVTRLAD